MRAPSTSVARLIVRGSSRARRRTFLQSSRCPRTNPLEFLASGAREKSEELRHPVVSLPSFFGSGAFRIGSGVCRDLHFPSRFPDCARERILFIGCL
jgi:hypothetical protein